MPVTPGIEVKGLATVQGMVAGLPGAWDKERTSALKQSGQHMVKLWKIHLSGPAGPRRLSVQTGRLRRSISVDRQRSTKEAVIVGSDAPYAAAHEFGFRGTVHVRAHRRTRKGGEAHAVRAHSRRMNLPERPHRKPAVRDMVPIHTKFMSGAVDEAIRDAKATANRRKFQTRAAFGDIVRAGGTGRR